MPTVKKGDYIQMDASVAGLDFSYSPDQALHVGHDIEVGLANAYVNDPPNEPRAHVISKADGERLKQEQIGGIPEKPLHEVPRKSEKRSEPEPEPEPEADPDEADDADQGEGEDDVEERSEQQAEEHATQPDAETRETAVQKRSRKRVKPPEEGDGETGFEG